MNFFICFFSYLEKSSKIYSITHTVESTNWMKKFMLICVSDLTKFLKLNLHTETLIRLVNSVFISLFAIFVGLFLNSSGKKFDFHLKSWIFRHSNRFILLQAHLRHKTRLTTTNFTNFCICNSFTFFYGLRSFVDKSDF